MVLLVEIGMMQVFKANTQSWEEANPDIFKLLRKNALIETDKQLWNNQCSMPVI